jgi:hypothetical protein
MSLNRPFTNILFALGAFVVLCSSFSSAQVVVEGLISDPVGALVPHVPLSLQRQDHSYKQNTVSDENGMFHLLAVPPGRYILSIAAVDGFDDYATDIQIGQKTPSLIEVVLALASVQQQTNVGDQNSVTVDPSDNRDQIVTAGSTLAHLPVLDQNYIATLTPFLDYAGVATSGVSIIVDALK